MLYARIGHQHCPKCGREVSQQTLQQIVDAVLSLPDGSRILLLAPLVQGRKGEYKNIFEEMRRSGYVRVRVDGKILDLSDEIELDKQKKHTIEVVVDRLIIRKQKKQADEELNGNAPLKKVAEPAALYEVNAARQSHVDEDGIAEPDIPAIIHEEIDPAFRQRISDSLETTLKLGNGVVLVAVVDGEEILFSEKASCVYCGISLPEIAPRTFSFNSPHGACPTCTGLGTQLEIDTELIVTNPDLSILQGAIAPWSKVVNGSQWYMATLEALAQRYHFELNKPWKELSSDIQQKLLYGDDEPLSIRYTHNMVIPNPTPPTLKVLFLIWIAATNRLRARVYAKISRAICRPACVQIAMEPA
ncbi:hypothetical protein KDK_34800 [Dictyobacter kobayashii]|uniref:UvrA interaction domain-containing protein n=1 Tax=Dictyobacter kobayashii TaxID=2014872 RepID=A0A402AKY3_9CHLR|nr:hypothetical protein KDK_34800 [Dictyobacter kobayashii]